MKEFLKETQPIFYRILEKSFKENKKTPEYILKRKLMNWVHDIQIKEI